MTALAPNTKEPSHRVQPVEGVVPTSEEKNTMSMTDTVNAVNTERPSWATSEQVYEPDEPEATWTEYIGNSVDVRLSMSMGRTTPDPITVEPYLFTDPDHRVGRSLPAANRPLVRLTVVADDFSQILLHPTEARQFAAHLLQTADMLDGAGSPALARAILADATGSAR